MPSILFALWRRNGDFPAVEEALIAVSCFCPAELHVLFKHLCSMKLTDMEIIQARMTQVVVEAEQADRLPPMDMRPGDFSSNHGGLPTISELKSARALHHLARALSIAFCHHNAFLPVDRQWDVGRNGVQTSGPPERTPEEPSRMPAWSARVHKAIYSTMIAGAALAGIYNEPMFKAKTHSDAKIRQLAPVEPQYGGFLYDVLSAQENGLTCEEFYNFLHDCSPVCRITLPPETEDQLFGPLAAWLVDNILSDQQTREAMAERFAKQYGRGVFCGDHFDSPPDPPQTCRQTSIEGEELSETCPLTSVEGGQTHSDVHLVLWEIMQIAWAFVHILGTLDLDHLPEEHDELQSEVLEGSATAVEAVAIFFGTFKTQQIIVPKNLDSFVEHPTFRFRFMNCVDVDGTRKYRVSSERGPIFPYQPDPYADPWSWNQVSSFDGHKTVVKHFEDIYWESGQPNSTNNEDDEDWLTPLLFKFFQYTLERHLGVTFKPNIFAHQHVWWEHEEFSVFLWALAVFAHDDENLWERKGVMADYAHDYAFTEEKT